MKLTVLSMGGGVQSTALALMAARGDLPRPDFAIFADTGWESRATYRHLDWLEQELPFPLRRVRREGPDLGEHAIMVARGEVKRTAGPPWYTRDPDGMLPQQCSKEYKVRTIYKALRDELGIAPRQRAPKGTAVEEWLGISIDEAHRQKPSELVWIHHRYPLIEAGISRRDCLRWMAERQYATPPKSACLFCPWHDIGRWREMKAGEPEDWARVLAFDAAIRPGFPGMAGTAHITRHLLPLDEVDLRPEAERIGQADLFGNECEGVCGI